MPTSSFLKLVLEASWQGSLVIALILLVRPLLGWRVPAQWRTGLWALVLLRLLVPSFLLPGSPASLQNIPVVDRPFEHVGIPFDATPEAPPATSLVRQGPDSSDESAAATPPPSSSPRPLRAWRLAAWIWLAGTVCLASWILLASLRLHRRLRRQARPVDEKIRLIWRQCCERLGVSRPPRLMAATSVDSPALIGLLRPDLVIPAANLDLSREDWEHVFFHELAHYRLRDHWLQALQLLALCAHWFNPFVWLGFRYLRADRELAADEWALRHLGESRPLAYGHTLLKVLSAQSRPVVPVCMVGIGEDVAQSRLRLRHIVAFSSRRLIGAIAGAALLLALAAMVLGKSAEKGNAVKGEADGPTMEALSTAARRGDRAMIEKMMEAGASVNGVSSGARDQRTPLAVAAASHQLAIVQFLLEKGADINLAVKKADAPITAALKAGWLDGAELLLSRGAQCLPERMAAARGDSAAITAYLAKEPADFDQYKLLCEIAAAHGHRDLMASLYDAIHLLPGHSRWEIGNGPIMTAVGRGHRDVVEELIRRESPRLRTKVIRFSGAAARTPGMREWLQTKGFEVPEYSDGERLIDAAEREDLDEIRRLLAAGVDVNYRGESDWTPITKAATWGCPRAVKLLLENRADANTFKHAHSALRLAKTPEIADLLFAAGANVNALAGRTHIISYCVTFGPTEMVQWFLDHGVDPARVKSSEPTLLFEAANPAIAELLIARGVDIHARQAWGETALHFLARYGNHAAETMRVLLQHGADPNARSDQGVTPLMVVRDAASVDVLMEFGADLSATTADGFNVLNAAFASTDASRLEALLRHGVKLDAQSGTDLLIRAVSGEQADLVKLLLEKGFDPNTKIPMRPGSAATWSPMSAIRSESSTGIARMLIAHGGDATGNMRDAVAKGHRSLVRLYWESGVRNISELTYAVTQSRPAPELAALIKKAGTTHPPEDTDVPPLAAAAVLGQMDAVKLLLEHGADPNAADRRALAVAAGAGRDKVLGYLLDHGGRATPALLHVVANSSNPDPIGTPLASLNRVAQILLDNGALEGATEEDVANLLIGAMMIPNNSGNPALIRMLLERGVSVHARTSRITQFATAGPMLKTPQSVLDVIAVLEKSGWTANPEAVALLRQAGAKQK